MNIDKNKLILWCPHPNYLDHFIVVSSYIRLYQTRNTATAIPPTAQLTSLSDAAPAATAAAAAAASASAPTDVVSPFRFVDQIKYPQQSIRAVSFAPPSASSSSPLLLAAGLLSGKLELLSFSHGDQRVLKEFDPRYQRACHAVSWNPTHQQQVAIALDRVRSSPGVLVWDIDKRGLGTMQRSVGGGGSASMTINSHHNQPLDTVTEALIGVNLSEASFSLAWLPTSPHCLVVGTGFKWLRVYDIRQSPATAKPTSVVAHSKSVFGCKHDPFDGNRVATYSEDGIVKVWDYRQLTAPVYTIHSSGVKGVKPRPVIEMEWCSSSTGLLSTISKEEDIIRLWDLSGSLPSTADDLQRLAAVQPDTAECPPFKRLRGGGGSGGMGGGWLSSLSWHGADKQRLLTVTKDGVVEEQWLHDDVMAVWGAKGELVMAMDDRIQLVQQHAIDDVETAMRQRAILGYGLDVERNRRICRERKEGELERVWEWLAQAEDSGRDEDDTATPYDGVMSLLLPPHELAKFRAELPHRTSSVSYASTLPTSPSAHLYSPSSSSSSFDSILINTSSHTPPSKVYISAGRLATLHTCGWFDTFTPASSTATQRKGQLGVEHINYENELRNLEERGEWERAAMLAVFHLDLKRALSSLTLAAASAASASATASQAAPAPVNSTQDLGLVALALAGYQSIPASTADASSLWSRTFASTLQHKHMSNHLKAIFSFLSVSHPSRQSLHTFHALLTHATPTTPPLLSFRDRLAFAARFLPDADLSQYVRQSALHSLAGGGLEGLVLTGLSWGGGGEELMVRYVDVGGDVQTVAALACYGLVAQGTATTSTAGVGVGVRFERWISVYRGLLNRWMLWKERAKFDVARATLYTLHASNTKPASSSASSPLRLLLPATSPHLSARCTFCNQPLHFDSLTLHSQPTAGRPAGLPDRPGRRKLDGNRNVAGADVRSVRVRGCPHCKKSLPRCSICLVALDAAMPVGLPGGAGKRVSGAGGGAGGGGRGGVGDGEVGAGVGGGGVWDGVSNGVGAGVSVGLDAGGSSGYGGWFSWCQHCRHGGHADHLRDWFAQHEECPVHDCACRCQSRDRFT